MSIQPDREALLVEYEACLMDISQLDSDIWQAGSVFIGLSVIGFTLLLQTQAKTWGDFVVYVIVSAFGLALLRIWNRLVTGWLRLIHINFFRMREIEMILGMHWTLDKRIPTLDGVEVEVAP